MRAARLFRRVGAVVGLALPAMLVPAQVTDAAVPHNAAPHKAVPDKAVPNEAPAHGRIVVDDSVLTLSVTVQGRYLWDWDAPLPEVPAGESVAVVYHLRNNTLFDVVDVRVSDPVIGGGAIACPDGGATVPDLRPLSSVDCYASVPSAQGSHTGFASAVGCQEILFVPYEVADRAWIGYVGLPPAPPPPSTPPPPPPSTPPATHPPTPRPAPPTPRPRPATPKPAAVPVVPSPSPSPSPSASPTPSASPSRSAPPLYRALVVPVSATPSRPGVPTPLFILIMAMPAAAAAAAVFGRRK